MMTLKEKHEFVSQFSGKEEAMKYIASYCNVHGQEYVEMCGDFDLLSEVFGFDEDDFFMEANQGGMFASFKWYVKEVE